MCFAYFFDFVGIPLRTFTMNCPQVVQRGHMAQHVVVGKTESVARGSIATPPIGKHAPMLVGARYFLGSQ